MMNLVQGDCYTVMNVVFSLLHCLDRLGWYTLIIPQIWIFLRVNIEYARIALPTRVIRDL